MKVARSMICCIGAALLAAPVSAVFAAASAEIRDVEVVGHYFTTRVSSAGVRAEAKKPSAARYVVLKMAMVVPADNLKLFTGDFVLVYRRSDGKEGRANSTAICRALTAEIGEEKTCMVGRSGAWVSLQAGKRFVSLVFLVQSDVDLVEFYRIGVASPIAYRLGADRPTSVLISTNESSQRVPKVEQAIKAGGYQVVRTSNKLVRSTKGVVIHYAPGAEGHAREISQRIMQVTKVVPELKKTRLATRKDIVVWLGHFAGSALDNNLPTTGTSDEKTRSKPGIKSKRETGSTQSYSTIGVPLSSPTMKCPECEVMLGGKWQCKTRIEAGTISGAPTLCK